MEKALIQNKHEMVSLLVEKVDAKLTEFVKQRLDQLYAKVDIYKRHTSFFINCGM